jgi:NAD-dependent dihydropyrimidine dehydrogenase PreA subunit
MDNPKVNPEVCTGCGICIDTCPMEAIEMVNEVARIINDQCSNCRACVDECPVEAIS